MTPTGPTTDLDHDDAPDVPDLLARCEDALASGRTDEATDLLDAVALRRRDPLDDARFRAAEGRLAALGGRTAFAADALELAATAADAIDDAAADEVAAEARLDLVRMALRRGQIDGAAAAASRLGTLDGPRRTLVDAAVAVGRGEPPVLADLEAAADALLIDRGRASAAFVADTVGLALVWAEQYAAADRVLDRLARTARRDAALGPLPNVLAVQSLADLRASRYRAAAARADEAVRLADATSRPGLAAMPLGVLAVAEAVRGNAEVCHEAAARLREDASRTAGVDGGLSAEVPARAALGVLHLGLEEPAAAVAELEPLVDRAAAMPWLVMWQCDLAEALIAVDRRADAAKVVQAFVSAIGARQEGRAAAAAARSQALLADTDVPEAERLLARSEELLHVTGTPFGLARTLLVRGRLRRRWGDDASGRSDLGHAAALFQRVGAEGWAAQAEADRTSTAAVRAGIIHPVPLTPQELQVAGLVTTGRANKEIAELLFVSPRTVESHLGRIFRKLGVRSRSQLIARADEWGLRDQRSW